MAASVGRGYEGQHRLVAAATGVPLPAVSSVHADPAPHEAPNDAPADLSPAAAPVLTLVKAAPEPAQPVDDLADTKPHPVVRLFPLPVEPAAEPDRTRDVTAAVFAQVDAERDSSATADLADGTTGAIATTRTLRYVARHSA